MVDKRLYPKPASCVVFCVVVLLGPSWSWAADPQTVTRQPTEPASTTAGSRQETRKAWVVGAGGGMGWSRQTISFTGSKSTGSTVLLGLGTVAGRGLTDKLVLTGELGSRLGVSPVFFETIDIGTFTVLASYYPFENSGAFLSVGGGLSVVHYTRTSLFASGTREADENGYVVVGAAGYEWRVDETFALDLRFTLERYEFDEVFDELWTFLLGLQLRLYI